MTRTIMVTGATGGMGEVIAGELAAAGHTVLLHGRSEATATAAEVRIGPTAGSIRPIWADLETLAGVADLVGQVRAVAPDGLHALVNNAGAAFGERAVTVDGVERTVAVNHLAPAALTERLLPGLLAAAHSDRPARVIMVGSSLERFARDHDDWSYERRWSQVGAYAFGKFLNLAYTYALARRWAELPIRVDAVDPGVVLSGFQQRAGGLLGLVGRFGGPLMAGPEQGARRSIELAVADGTTPGGRYIGRRGPGRSSARSRSIAVQDRVHIQTAGYLNAVD